MQDTAVVLWRKFEELDSPEDFRRWAFGVARFQALAYRRDRARDRHVFSDDLISMLEKEAAEAGEKSSQEELALQECLTKLPSKHRKLVQAVYMGRERIDKIADKAGRTPMSLYKSLHRIRMSLADCINKHLSQHQGNSMKSSDEHMELIRLYLSGEAAKEDVTALESLMLEDDQLRADFLAYARVDAALPSMVGERPELTLFEKKPSKVHRWLLWAPAAALILISTMLGVMLIQKKVKTHKLLMPSPPCRLKGKWSPDSAHSMTASGLIPAPTFIPETPLPWASALNSARVMPRSSLVVGRD